MIPLRDWAARVIGAPYAAGGESVTGFYCWGLVRAGVMAVFDVTLGPDARTDSADTMRDAHAKGFRRHSILAVRDGDVVIGRSQREVHVGMAVTLNGRRGVLHALEGVGVVHQPIREAFAGMRCEVWRLTR
jgi:cell wall-associated NlpC family hydrolase